MSDVHQIIHQIVKKNAWRFVVICISSIPSSVECTLVQHFLARFVAASISRTILVSIGDDYAVAESLGNDLAVTDDSLATLFRRASPSGPLSVVLSDRPSDMTFPSWECWTRQQKRHTVFHYATATTDWLFREKPSILLINKWFGISKSMIWHITL